MRLILLSLLLFMSCRTSSTLDKNSILRNNIYIDKTWRKSDSPIKVAGNLWIMGPATLKIEKGTTVVFEKGAYMTVEGALHVNGTKLEPVIITANNPNSEEASWKHINIRNGRKKSIIKHAKISYSNSALFIENDDVEISNSTFSENEYAINIKNSSPKIVKNIFVNNKFGILSTGKNSSFISQNKFMNNRYIGLSSYDKFEARIEKNVFKNNEFGITLNFTEESSKKHQPEILFNDFIENQKANLHMSKYPNDLTLDVSSNYWGKEKNLKINGKVNTDPIILLPQY